MKKIALGILYWLIQLTWGALLTIPGLLITGFCILFLKGKAHKNGFSYIVEIGGDWGGVELGAVALCGNYSKTTYWDEIRTHEFGHSVFPQHILMGPLFPFLVGIPSACRYWYKRIMEEKYNKHFSADWYYKFWAEKNASVNGIKWINWIEDKNIINKHE